MAAAREALRACRARCRRRARGPWAGWPSPTISSACWPGCSREIQEVTNPDAIYQSVTQTGLALRDNTPRVYVIAAAGGGSSGMLRRPRLRAAPAARAACGTPTPRSTRLLLLRRPHRPGHAQGRAGQRLRHADRAEPLQRSDDPVRRPVRRRRPAHRRSGAAVPVGLPAAAGAPQPGGAGRSGRPPGQLPVPRADDAAGPAAGPRAQHGQPATPAPRRGCCRRRCAASAPTRSGSRAACCCTWPPARRASG